MMTLFSISYTVDPVGNRTGETVGSTSTSFTMDNDDELTSTSGGFANSYSYNANGEQTGRTLAGTAYTIAFDYDGQLKSITQGTAVTGFGYDALGRRVSRTASGTTTSTQYAGGAPVTETQGSTFTAAYTIGNDLLRRNGEYPAFDGLGSARAETNSSGTATATQDFDAFGNTIASSGSTSSPYNFAGDWAYQSDGDAGLQHVGARYYDPQVGRFASRDSMLDQIPYAYCGGDGANRVDPDGQQYSDWNPFTWDYNFDATDWQGVADGAYKIGGIEENPAEIIGPAVGLPSVMDPGLRQPTQIGGGMAEIKTGLFLPAERLSVTGVAGAVLVGMFAGGEITQHIVAPAISWLLGKG